MEINDKLLKKLSQLSALHLSQQEQTELKEYLKKTLSYFEKIKKLDTKGIKALVSPLKPPLVMRADKVEEFPHTEELLQQAPQKQGSLVKAPPTV